MTLPDENIHALNATRQFLRDLLDRKATPKVPKHIRQRASACIKHFPWATDDAVILKALEQEHGPSGLSNNDSTTEPENCNGSFFGVGGFSFDSETGLIRPLPSITLPVFPSKGAKK